MGAYFITEVMPTSQEALAVDKDGTGVPSTSTTDDKHEVCLTPGCVHAGEVLLSLTHYQTNFHFY